MNKKKIIIAVILLLLVVGTVLFFVFKNNKTVLTVSYEVNGEIVRTENVEEGKTAIKPSDPNKEGYEFLGWYLGDKEFDFSTNIKENIRLKAKWATKTTEQDKVYTITLNVDGDKKEVKTDANGMLKKIEEPTKSGYKFLGWYIDDEKVDFSKPFEKDTTIVAKWEKNKTTNTTKPTTPTEPEEPTVKKYTVTFDSDGGSKVSQQIVEEGKTAKKPSNPTKSKYKFLGWYLNGTEYNFSNKVSGNITLKAKWEYVPTITSSIEKVEGSIVGQAKVFVLKDGVKTAGYAEITTDKGTKTVSIPASGLDININKIVKIENPRLSK